MLGALSAALAVVVGAMGAHLPAAENGADWVETGQRYHLAHALGLVLTGGLMLLRPGAWALLAAWGLALGSLCFSGGLYLQAFAALSMGWVVPLGGLFFILGWLALALHAGRALSALTDRG